MPRSLVAVLALLTLALPSTAAVLIVPTDDEMIDGSAAIVVGKVRTMNAVFAENGDIVTEIDIDIERVLKGGIPATETLRLREPGGVVGTQAMFVSEAPAYWAGNRALIFLEQTTGGWRTWGTSLGKFDFVEDHDGRSLAVRWATENDHAARWTPEGRPHEEQLRDASRFVEYIARRAIHKERPDRPARNQSVQAEAPVADYFVEPRPVEKPAGWDPSTNATYPPSAYTQGTFRWDVFDNGGSVTFFVSGSQPNYDSIGAAQRALAAWTNEPGSNVDYRYGGTNNRGFVEDGVNTIVYNSPTDVPPGALAYARWYAGAVHTYKGETFYSISEGDVVVRSGISVPQKTFEETVTHELGHTLGFRHSDQGTPSSTQAVMKAVLSGQYGASLGPWDIEAVQTVYTGTSSPPTGTLGSPSNLVATATSTTTVNISWTAATNAQSYELQRAEVLNQWTTVRTGITSTSVTDTGLAANKTYLYRVRAVAGSSFSTYSNLDHATTILFTSDPLAPRSTIIRAVHLTEIRTAVNAVRIAAALPALNWTDPNPAGVTVKAIHINELRNGLQAALGALGKSAGFTDAIARGVIVKALHFQELRNYTK